MPVRLAEVSNNRLDQRRGKGMAGRHEKTWSFSYQDLAELTGMEIGAIHQAVSRGTRRVASGMNPEDFRSVVLWIFRNASDEFKLDIMCEMRWFRNPQAAKQMFKERAQRRTATSRQTEE